MRKDQKKILLFFAVIFGIFLVMWILAHLYRRKWGGYRRMGYEYGYDLSNYMMHHSDMYLTHHGNRNKCYDCEERGEVYGYKSKCFDCVHPKMMSRTQSIQYLQETPGTMPKMGHV